MKIDLKSEKINYVKPIFNRRFTHEEVLEVIVPDAQQDVLRVVNTDGIPYLRSKDADAGRVTTTGVVECAVVYIPENGEGVKRLDVNVPFTATADGANITSDCLIVAEVSVASAEAKMINSRKLVIKVELMCKVTCSVPCAFYASKAGEMRDIFVKAEQRQLLLPASVNEKTFIFTDELHLKSGAEPVGEILSAKVNLVCDEIKPVGRKAVIKGNAYTEIAYCMKESAQVNLEHFTTPFSQIVEIDAESEPARFCVSLMLTSVYISRSSLEEAGGERLSVEMHAVAQVTAYSEYNFSFISDSYSPKYDVTAVSQELAFVCQDDTSDFSDTVKCAIPVEDADSLRLLSVNPIQITCSGDGPTSVTVVFNAAVMYEDRSGGLWSVSKKLECSHEFEAAVESQDVTASCGECFSSITGSEIELRVPIYISVRKATVLRLNVIEELEYDEETVKSKGELPSITVTRAGERCELWELAKKYGSSVELITAYNGLSPETTIGSENVLLIPRIS